MKQDLIDQIKDLEEGWCNDKLKAACREFLNVIGTEKQALFAPRFIEVLEWSLCTMEELEQFVGSKTGQAVLLEGFGSEEKVNEYKKHVEHLKESGAEYCDCPACSKAYKILQRKDEFLD